MITFDELNEQNHKITEISNVFLYLIENRKMCDTQITCDLFFDYVDKVKHHLESEDNAIYTRILTDGDAQAKEVAENFMSGSREIKRIFQTYLRKWQKKGSNQLVITNYSEFVAETQEMFEIVLHRIQHETEQLYPLVRKISGDMQKVA